MKTALYCLAFVAVLILMLISCHKEKTVATGTTYSSVTDFINRNGAQAQSFTLNATNGGIFTGAKGTVFSFPPNAFVNSANQPVTGTVNFQLLEIYSNSDMILSNKTTVANGNVPLISGGEFFIQATQNNQPLHIAPYTTYQATLPADTFVPGMNVYTWNANNTTADAQWKIVADSFNNIYEGSGTGNTNYNYDYILYSDSINWINCDCVCPNPSGNYYVITANTVNCPDVMQTNVYVFVNGHHAVWQLSSSSGNQFTTPQDIVPGIPLTIVGMCVSGGKVYSAFTPVTVTANQTINLNFAATTDTIFKTQVAALH